MIDPSMLGGPTQAGMPPTAGQAGQGGMNPAMLLAMLAASKHKGKGKGKKKGRRGRAAKKR